MIRNYGNLDIYLNRLLSDIYPQPPDEGHTQMALDVFNKWFLPNNLGKSVLDVGCGDTAFMRPHFEILNMEYTGVALKVTNPEVINMDFNFLEFPDDTFDCVFSRHSLEHSPMPLISLMEWYRVAKFFLCIIIPNPDHYGWTGLNHYSVMNEEHLLFLLKRAGWYPIWGDTTEPTEIRFMCQKKADIQYE